MNQCESVNQGHKTVSWISESVWIKATKSVWISESAVNQPWIKATKWINAKNPALLLTYSQAWIKIFEHAYSPYVNKNPPLKVRAGPIWANLEPVGFIISTFLSNLGVVGFININFLDPQNDRFLAFSPCKTAKRVQKNFRRASRAGNFLGWWVLLFQILRPISIR